MKWNEAINIVKQEYKTYTSAPNQEVIDLDKLLDFNGCYYITLFNDGGIVKITDMACTQEHIHQTKAEWIDLCNKYGFEFNNWHIEKVFTGLDDVHNFIALLDEIALAD